MDTRQLAAFCAIVERKSFSEAAERLGVTQPAVSQQIRSLEDRLGQQLLDRSGRRVEPTEAGNRLYRSAQRMLALERQLLDEVAGDAEGPLRGQLALGASTGPGGTVVPVLLCEFAEANPDVTVDLTISDTQTIVEQVARRELELGVVGATPRNRSVAYEPFFHDEVILVCPPEHRFAGKTVALEDLRDEQLIAMQEGAGVRQVIDDELRDAGARLSDLGVRLELGLQESVKSAVEAGHGVTFISRTAVERELENGTLAEARVRGLEPSREISLVRAGGRVSTRVADAFVRFGREAGRNCLRAGAHARLTATGDHRHGDERPRPRGRSPLRQGAKRGWRPRGAVRRAADRRMAPSGRRDAGGPRGAARAPRGRDARRNRARVGRSRPCPRHGTGSRRTLRPPARRDERDRAPARAALQRAGRKRRDRTLRRGARHRRPDRPRAGARPARWIQAPPRPRRARERARRGRGGRRRPTGRAGESAPGNAFPNLRPAALGLLERACSFPPAVLLTHHGSPLFEFSLQPV